MVYDLAMDDDVLVTDKTIAALQELDMIFLTEHTELLGDYNYGCALERFLWDLVPSLSEIKQYIEKKLKDTIYVSQFNYTIDVYDMTYQTPQSFNRITGGSVEYDEEKNYSIFIDLFGGDQPYKKTKKGLKVIMF